MRASGPRLLALLVALTLVPAAAFAQAYTSIVVLGDSLSDTGNVANLTTAKYTAALRIPGPVANYSDGRFTDGADTTPAAHAYFGVWVEQLAALLPARPTIKNSLNGGTDYAFGLATTAGGTRTFAFGPGNVYSVQVENMGQQLADYLATNPTITNKTLFIVWGGANDLLNATTSAQIVAAAQQEAAILNQLIAAGATDFIVPNLPPLGLIPRLNGSTTASASVTQAAAGFNQALAASLAALPAAYPSKTLRIYSLDVFSLFNTIVGPPLATGYSNVTASSQIDPLANPDTYLFWDDLHPTTLGHHSLAIAAAALIATAATTATTLAASTLAANLGAAVTLTATVSATGGVPTGTVTFFDGTTSIGTATLASATATTATATLTTAALAAGTHTLMAVYGGTTATAGPGTYASSSSATISEVVTAPSFSSVLSPTSVTVARGASVTSTVTVTSAGGYTGTVSLACGTLANDLSCAFSPTSLAFTGVNGAKTSTLTVSTLGNYALLRHNSDTLGIFSALLLLPCFGLGGAFVLRRRGAGLGKLAGLVLLTGGVVAGIGGCTAPDNRAPSGSYTVPVQVSASGSSTSTLNLTVVVQ